MTTEKKLCYHAFALLGATLLLFSSCQKENVPALSAVDADGNVYRTVVIGRQEWFAENLRTTRYNDGTPITNVTEHWDTQNTGAYCWYNNQPDNGNKYGALYNWIAVKTGKLCPAGWHVPSVEEWQALMDYAAPDNAVKLKSTSGWYNNGNGTDDYGFSALPGGYCDVFFKDLGLYGHWWSNYGFVHEQVWELAESREMYWGYKTVYGALMYSTIGFSVRCVRDN